MKIDPVLVARLVGRFLPVIREVGAALAKKGPGGRGVTPEERDEILGRLIAIVDDELAA